MAGHAILRRGLVEQDCLGGNDFGQFVTVGAFDVLMGAAQCESCPFVVIEQGRLPLHAVVAVGAGGSVPFGELLSVDVLMAVLAQGGGCLEIHVDQIGFEVRRLMAVDAGRRPMCPEQGKLGLGMVETGKFFPGLGAMAGLATARGTVGPDLLHAFLELALVDILVATGAVQTFPVINDVRFGLELRGLLMAFGTCNSDVAASQRKAGLLVLGQSEG